MRPGDRDVKVTIISELSASAGRKPPYTKNGTPCPRVPAAHAGREPENGTVQQKGLPQGYLRRASLISTMKETSNPTPPHSSTKPPHSPLNRLQSSCANEGFINMPITSHSPRPARRHPTRNPPVETRGRYSDTSRGSEAP